MTLPVYQRHGYGRFLIEFSYLLSRREGMAGTPEKPLSDLGKISYQAFWKSTILKFIKDAETTTVEEISTATGINIHDIAATLQTLNMLLYKEEDEVPKYFIRIDKSLLECLEKKRVHIDEECLKWTPLLLPKPVAPEEEETEDMDDDIHPEFTIDERKMKSGPIETIKKLKKSLDKSPETESIKCKNVSPYQRNESVTS